MMRVWKRLPKWRIPKNFVPSTHVSIIIPARNEEGNIEKCLEAISKQTYPASLREVIVIDDFSADKTMEVARNWLWKGVKVLSLRDILIDEAKGGKKKAIEEGIRAAQGKLIITTDADSISGPKWLENIVSYYQSQDVRILTAPVVFHKDKTLIERFQALDFLGMMGITAVGINRKWFHLANGANLAYEKEIFYEVGGFEGIDDVASGDDVLLIQKVAARFPGKIGFVKSKGAVVFTKPKPDFKSFLNQRIRWASKSAYYKEDSLLFTQSLVFLFCIFIILSFFSIPFLGWMAYWVFLSLFMIKALLDYYFLREVTEFFGRKKLLKSFWVAEVLHIVYITSAGLLGTLKKEYNWKDRRVN